MLGAASGSQDFAAGRGGSLELCPPPPPPSPLLPSQDWIKGQCLQDEKEAEKEGKESEKRKGERGEEGAAETHPPRSEVVQTAGGGRVFHGSRSRPAPRPTLRPLVAARCVLGAVLHAEVTERSRFWFASSRRLRLPVGPHAQVSGASVKPLTRTSSVPR